MNRRSIARLHLLPLAFLLAVPACDGDAGGEGPAGDGLRVSGRIGAGYRVASALREGALSRAVSEPAGDPPVAAEGPAVDRVVALKVDRGSLNTGSLPERLEAAVDPDGTFVLDLDRQFDWVLVLVDSTAAGAARFVGSVAFGAGSGNGLLALPVATAQVPRVDLGTLSRQIAPGATADATASEPVVPRDFGLTSDQLLALSKTDDVFRNARNLLANHDPATGTWYAILPAFTWVNDSPAAPDFTTPSAGRFDGYGLQLDTNSPSVSIRQACGDGVPRVDMGLYPPVPVEALLPPGAVYGPDRGMANDEVTACTTQGSITNASDRDFFAGHDAANTERTLSCGFSGVSFPYPIPAGDWTWREAGVSRAAFDLSVAAPLAAEGAQAGFVPSLRLVAGADGRVTAAEFRWSYRDDAAGEYRVLEAADAGLLRHGLGKVEAGFYEAGHDTDTVEKIQFDPAAVASLAPADAWYLGAEPPSGGKRLEKVVVFFEIGGIGRVVMFTGVP